MTTSATQMEAALSPTLDHPEMENNLEAVGPIMCVLEHQMNVKIATKWCFVLQVSLSRSKLMKIDISFIFRNKNQ